MPGDTIEGGGVARPSPATVAAACPLGTERLAAWVAGLRWVDLPPAVRDAAPYFLLDYLGNAIGGSRAESSAAMGRFLRGLGLAGAATAIASELRLPPQYAALWNGQAAHCLESDDTHQASSSHPGASVWSAALAAGELTSASRERVFTAAVAGYEVVGRLGAALGPAQHYARGFHPTGTCGALGCAAVAANLLGLDGAATANAFGIALSQGAGSMEFLSGGAWTKRFHPGWAAHSGLLAALLAREGFTGPRAAIEGKDGFLRSYSDAPRAELVLHALGSDFQILRTSIKAHACCRYKQAPIDGLLALVRQHRLAPSDVARITIGVLGAGFGIIAEPRAQKLAPQSVVDAQFSMPYGAAVALLHGRASIREYAPEVLGDPAVRHEMEKVVCVRDAALDARFPRQWPAWTEVETSDGRRLRAAIDYPKGDPENPLSDDELAAKFEELCGTTLDGARRRAIIAAVRDPDATRPIADLTRLLGRG